MIVRRPFTPTTPQEQRRLADEARNKRLALIQALREIAPQVPDRVKGQLGQDVKDILDFCRGRLVKQGQQ